MPLIEMVLPVLSAISDVPLPGAICKVPLERLTIGGICIYKNARRLMEDRIGVKNCISGNIDKSTESVDGRARYFSETRQKMYHFISEIVQETNPETRIALCLEEPDVWEKLGLTKNLGCCNCVL